MQLCIGASEATLYDDMGKKIRDFGFISGAEVVDPDNIQLATVGGSDEYSFSVRGVVRVRIIRPSRYARRRIIATVKWKEVVKHGNES
jgi:hypothetical protein